eukprot:CAMPEP_0118698676 /NCGR_PEP_ID=MMETSP0800-20121206/15359_1 /TAXON_ID=210618 ORGANISM="Striatella unipunctata, Strain CCMP2910" /NCGR_SAMPLE_ID=MMETSP0800 /ASSEMBLY_ACC=CAM_ASM_000638 /LENGTH=167 /DNA_ID=CAMNT_0006598575 /DNA_START=272 /DNA_END=775 /DNA_ORIENTATION=+
MAASYVEFMAKLMLLGREQVVYFLWTKFNTSDWLVRTSGSDEDEVGARVMELLSILVHGLYLWIDAFEWFAITLIMMFLYKSVHRIYYENDSPLFSYSWASLGMTIGVMNFFDLIASVLRLRYDFRTFHQLALIISILNTTLLLPVWMLWLGRQLSSAADKIPDFNK